MAVKNEATGKPMTDQEILAMIAERDALKAQVAAPRSARPTGFDGAVNVTAERDEKDSHILVLRIDLRKDSGPSSTGKSLTVATTKGNVSTGYVRPDGKTVFAGINFYAK